jgi:ATP-binding cassette subfamily B protein
MFVNQGSSSMLSPLGNPGSTVTTQRIRPDTIRRLLSYIKRHGRSLTFLLLTAVVDSLIIVSTPLLLKEIIDRGIMQRDMGMVTTIAGIVAALALLDAVMQFGQNYFSARLGHDVSYDLRIQAFNHVQRQSLAFFTRSQTGSLVSRLNTDVVVAQQAFATLLVGASSLLTLLLVLVEMFYLSWQVSVIVLVMLPLFIVPVVLVGRRLQRYSREQMQAVAEMGGLLNERFNIAGAMLAKLFGRPRDEMALFERRARHVREIGVVWSVNSRLSLVMMTFLAASVTALVYGLGGGLVINGVFQLGSLVALAALLGRLYGPITQLSGLQANALSAMVSFDRIFEVLDLKPLIAERPGAAPLAVPRGGPAPEIEFERVKFSYPRASEVSLPSLESISLPQDERSKPTQEVLREVSFRAPAGKLTALVGPSGAGKTTITHLISRLYDPGSGTVRIAGHDLREVTLDSLRDAVGVVTQDPHFFHDTVRANLAYARPGAVEEELVEACRAAQIWDLISSLPSGLDTVVGERGFRLSGGEKQRLALARLLLKAPSIVVLDEATAHLDSESELAIQDALRTALEGRTSVVIAHRLSTIREADQILVIDEGRVCERGTHEELLAAGSLYAELYRTQFARQAGNGRRESPPEGDAGDGGAPQQTPQQVITGRGPVVFRGGPPPDGVFQHIVRRPPDES